MLLTYWVNGDIRQTFSYLIAREAFSLRCSYLMKCGRKENGGIYFPCSDIDNPLNKLTIDNTYLPIAAGKYDDTVFLADVYNQKKLDYLLEEEERLKIHDRHNPVWESVSLEEFFRETVNMVKAMSLHPLLFDWGWIYDYALVDDFDRTEFLAWYQEHKSEYPFQIDGRQVVNFNPVKYEVHNAMIEYLKRTASV